MNKKGFTLIEMLVVIAVIAVLVSIVIPVIGQSTTRAAAATNAANLRSMYGKISILKLQNPSDYETMMSGNHHNGITIGDGTFIGKILEEMAVDRFATFNAVNGKITMPISGVVIDALPSAKVVNYKGGFNTNSVCVPEGTQMTIVITDDQLIAVYANYTVENFADIAEDGKLDGVVYGGYLNEVANSICQRYGHRFKDFWGRDSDTCLICKYIR